MRTNPLFALPCSLIILGFMLASCAPPAAAPKAAAPASKVETPAPKPAAAPATPSPTPKPAAEQPRYGGTLNVASRLVIPNFDMHQNTSIAIQMPTAPIYSSLIQNDPLDEDKIIGDLAQSWDISADGRTYTFRLRDGVKFHDGNPLTSQDVKANFERIAFPPKGMFSPRGALYQTLDRVEAPDPLSVKMTLKQPQGSFLQLVALPFNFIYPSYILKEKGDMKRSILGSGPFKFLSDSPGVSFKLKKNPDYFIKGRPYLDGITYYIVADETTRFAALRTKQLHVLPPSTETTSANVQELRKSHPKIVAQQVIQTANQAFIPNLRVKPWDDVRVRRAVSLVVDREAAGKVVRGGYYPGYGYMVPKTPWALPEEELKAMPGFRQPKDQDIAEAKRLLAEAGYPQGFKTVVQGNPSVHTKEAAEFLQNELAKIGITATIQPVELAVLRERLFKREFQSTVTSNSPAHTDPDVVMGGFYITGSEQNYGDWSNARLDRLYEEQSRTMDMAKRVEIVREMQRIIHQEAPTTIITWARRWAVMWPEVRDWESGICAYHNNKMEQVWLAQ